jgi:hypothetical protein
MNKGRTYRVTVTEITDAGDGVAPLNELVFTHRNHDDLARIVLLVRESSGLDADHSAALAVGLKLLGQTVLEHKANPLLDGLRTPLREFITALKARRG